MKSFLAVIIAISSMSVVQAQSLVDAAKKAQDDRDKAKQTEHTGQNRRLGGDTGLYQRGPLGRAAGRDVSQRCEVPALHESREGRRPRHRRKKGRGDNLA